MKLRTTFSIFTIIILFSLFACGGPQAVVKNNPGSVSAAPERIAEYVIQPGDGLDIKFFYNPELNESITVRPDGKISLQLIDEVQAAGQTPSQLDKVLTEEYGKELKKPEITIIIRSFTGQRVYVGGEVNTPGLIDLTNRMSALQAVISAGGFSETAKPEAAIVIRKGRDNLPIPMRVDLKKALFGKGAGAEFQLKPYDIVYVPKTAIAKANKWVNQYIENLFLYRGVSFGFSYRVDDWSDEIR